MKICRLSKLPWPRWQLLKLASHPQVFNIYLKAEFWKRCIINSFCAQVRGFICFCFPHGEKIYIYIQERYFLSTRSNVVKSLFQENLYFRSFTTSEKWKGTALLIHSPSYLHNSNLGSRQFRTICSFCPKLPRTQVRLYCYANEKSYQWKGLLLPYSLSALTGKITFLMW